MTKVRVRFAPSPTGLIHLGGLRTALFNWLFARAKGGTFILRFEDTDLKRRVPVAETHIFESLDWAGLTPDEGPIQGGSHGPYRQSQRLDIYRQYARELEGMGRLYKDWTSPDKLAQLRNSVAQAKQPFRVRPEMLDTTGLASRPHVLRFKIKTSGVTTWHDGVHRKQSWDNNQLDDFVAIKSDGYPTYNFANVIDDHLMGITQVMRGDEFLASTPKHLQIYGALGWQPPEFIHLPGVLAKDKSKLSKRQGAIDALDYRARGYLPEAVTNYLALLGWHPGNEQEVFVLKELVEKFELNRLHSSPAVFDNDRLEWFNAQHIRRLKPTDLLGRADAFWPQQAKGATTDKKRRVLKVLQERLRRLDELPELSNFIFKTGGLKRPAIARLDREFARDIKGLSLADWLSQVSRVVSVTAFDIQSLEAALRRLVDKKIGTTKSALWSVLREILTYGEAKTPPIWEIIYVLGKTEAIRRLKAAARLL